MAEIWQDTEQGDMNKEKHVFKLIAQVKSKLPLKVQENFETVAANSWDDFVRRCKGYFKMSLQKDKRPYPSRSGDQHYGNRQWAGSNVQKQTHRHNCDECGPNNSHPTKDCRYLKRPVGQQNERVFQMTEDEYEYMHSSENEAFQNMDDDFDFEGYRETEDIERMSWKEAETINGMIPVEKIQEAKKLNFKTGFTGQRKWGCNTCKTNEHSYTACPKAVRCKVEICGGYHDTKRCFYDPTNTEVYNSKEAVDFRAKRPLAYKQHIAFLKTQPKNGRGSL